MNLIQLNFNISDDGGLKSITFSYNDTELPDNSTTLKLLAESVLASLKLNHDDIIVQDLLNDLDIKAPE